MQKITVSVKGSKLMGANLNKSSHTNFLMVVIIDQNNPLGQLTVTCICKITKVVK